MNSELEEAGNGKASLTEVNKELSNPISTIWALSFQQNTFWLNKPERNVVNLLFQPVLPVSLTDNWNLITRPVIPVFNSTPYINKSGNLHRVTGFGDTVLVELLSPSPKLVGPWLLGAGPTFIFPTASNSRLGQNKWQIGPHRTTRISRRKVDRRRVSPAVVVSRRPGSNTISQMNLQYFFAYFPAAGWSVGTSPNMLVNWYASKSGNKVTFPIGLNVSKVVKIGPLPVNSRSRDSTCPSIRSIRAKMGSPVLVTPVIPKLIRGNLFASYISHSEKVNRCGSTETINCRIHGFAKAELVPVASYHCVRGPMAKIRKLFLVLGAALFLVIAWRLVPASAQEIDRTRLPIPDTQYKYPGKVPLDARDAKFPPIKLLAARGCTQRSRDSARRHRLRRAEHFRWRHQHAHARRARKAGPALYPVPHDRALLADAPGLADRSQPSFGRDGRDYRIGDQRAGIQLNPSQ